MTADDDFEPTAHDLRMAEEAAQDRRRGMPSVEPVKTFCRCASEGCDNAAAYEVGAGGVFSRHCIDCTNRIVSQAICDRRADTERGLAGVQRHETGGEASPEAKEPSSMAISVARAIYDLGYASIDKAAALVIAEAAIAEASNYPHRGEKR